jgi:hypothetical protein
MRHLFSCIALTVLGGSALVSAPVAASDRALDAAINDLAPNKHIRVWTVGFRVFQGRFIRADGDSLYLRSLPDGAHAARATDGGVSTASNAVCLSDIDRMCVIEPHGISRGLQWAGGVLLIGGALTLGAGADSLDEGGLMVGLGVTIGAAFYALFKGSTGTREREVYTLH